jgi:YgiT-type zinc finger domain-containing protein
MVCTICKHGETKQGMTDLMLKRDNLIMVIRGVPAQVCNICGEACTDERTTANLLKSAEDAVKVSFDISSMPGLLGQLSPDPLWGNLYAHMP